MKVKDQRKILVLDIEWAPAKAYVWRMFKENISPDQLIDEGGMLCFAAHWYGTKDFVFASEWDDGREGMARLALQLLGEADAVVTYNGDKYDLPKIRGEIVLANLSPPPPVTSIDLLKTVKKLGFVMNRLAYVGPLLGVGSKMKHEGFSLWKSVLDGDERARKRMKKYCIQDVRMTAMLYKRLLPYIANHPNLGFSPAGSCGSCGSTRTQRPGFRRTKSFVIQRIQCQDCGAWSDGQRRGVDKISETERGNAV